MLHSNIMKTVPLLPLLALSVGSWLVPATSEAEETVFEQSFTSDASDDTWQNVSQRGQAKITTLADDQPALRINNHVIGHTLPKPLTEDFTLEVEALHSEDAAVLWFGLFDKLLEHGYVVVWQNPPTAQGYVNGKLSLRKVSLSAGAKPEILLMNKDRSRQSIVLGQEFVVPPHPTQQTPPAKLSLSWDKATGTLVLSCDGQEMLRTTDTDLNQFDAVLLSGNKFSLYRSVTVKGQ
jgi:hypothetical protein